MRFLSFSQQTPVLFPSPVDMPGVSWPRYLKMMGASVAAMFAGAQVVHLYYLPDLVSETSTVVFTGLITSAWLGLFSTVSSLGWWTRNINVYTPICWNMSRRSVYLIWCLSARLFQRSHRSQVSCKLSCLDTNCERMLQLCSRRGTEAVRVVTSRPTCDVTDCCGWMLLPVDREEAGVLASSAESQTIKHPCKCHLWRSEFQPLYL